MVRQVADGNYTACPLGGPGDLLWVREPWALVNGQPVYAAKDVDTVTDGGWQPAKSMPEEHARIRLRLTATRLERLCEIPAEDLVSEGSLWLERPLRGELPHAGFARWWDSLHPRPGTQWADNPLVWVLSFIRA